MKLYMWPTSPYVAKTLAVISFKALEADIHKIMAHPWQRDSCIPSDNPLGKIPTLILENGQALYDSRVICEYLDGIGKGQKLFPEVQSARWKALRFQALADGIMDAAVGIQYELRFRPKALQSQDWVARQTRSIERSVRYIENTYDALTSASDTIGSIAVGMALSYLNLRMPAFMWTSACPKLSEWWNNYMQNSFMQKNAPSTHLPVPENLEPLAC